MQRITVTALAMLAGLCTAGGLQAQTHEFRATIPFTFVVGNKQLPAGNYDFVPQNDHTLVIQASARPIAAIIMMTGAEGTPDNVRRVVFEKYGGYYFLSALRSESKGLSAHIPPSKLEKKARAEQLTTEHALLAPEKVVVAVGD